MAKLFVSFVAGIVVITIVNSAHLVSSVKTKTYDSPDGGTVSCLIRTREDACPRDHEIRSCNQSNTKVACFPCNIKAGYRTCTQIYSEIDYVKCYRPGIYCKPEEFLIIHTLPDGGCYNTTCVKECDSTAGYVQNQSKCVPLPQKCPVNSTVIDGACRPCPKGLYKPNVGFDKCTTIPKSKSITAQPQESAPGKKASESDVTSTSVPSILVVDETTKARTSGTEHAGQSTATSTILLATIIPSVLLVIMIILICVFRPCCRHNGERGFLVNCCIFHNYYCCCVSIKEASNEPVNGAVRFTVDADPERGEINLEDSPVAQNSQSPPPTYATNDPAKNEFATANDQVSHRREHEVRDVPFPTKEIIQPPPTPPPKGASLPVVEDVNDSGKEERTPLISKMSSSTDASIFPTLLTKGSSSLVPGNQPSRPNRADATENGLEMKVVSDAEIERLQMKSGHGELPDDGTGRSDDLELFTFGSHLRVSSISEISDTPSQ